MLCLLVVIYIWQLHSLIFGLKLLIFPPFTWTYVSYLNFTYFSFKPMLCISKSEVIAKSGFYKSLYVDFIITYIFHFSFSINFLTSSVKFLAALFIFKHSMLFFIVNWLDALKFQFCLKHRLSFAMLVVNYRYAI